MTRLKTEINHMSNPVEMPVNKLQSPLTIWYYNVSCNKWWIWITEFAQQIPQGSATSY